MPQYRSAATQLRFRATYRPKPASSNRIARGEGVGLVSRGRLEAYDASGQERWGHGGAAWGGPVYLSAPASYGRLVYVGDPAALYALVPPQ